MVYIVALIIALIIIILLIKFWFVTLPIFAIIITLFIIFRQRNKNKQMSWTEIEKYKKYEKGY